MQKAGSASRGLSAPSAAVQETPIGMRQSTFSAGQTVRCCLWRLRVGGPVKQEPAGEAHNALLRNLSPSGPSGCQQTCCEDACQTFQSCDRRRTAAADATADATLENV